jgi:mannose-6-phosphate isomerase-like protein (cupin superfamily)
MKFKDYLKEEEQKPFDVRDIEDETVENNYFRKVLYTGKHLQLVLMAIEPNSEIGNEVHNDTDQFFRIDEGEGKVVVNNKEEIPIKDGSSILIRQGTYHNVVNTSSTKKLKLYSLYAPPHHPPGTVHKTKEEAEEYEKEEK